MLVVGQPSNSIPYLPLLLCAINASIRSISRLDFFGRPHPQSNINKKPSFPSPSGLFPPSCVLIAVFDLSPLVAHLHTHPFFFPHVTLERLDSEIRKPTIRKRHHHHQQPQRLPTLFFIIFDTLAVTTTTNTTTTERFRWFACQY